MRNIISLIRKIAKTAYESLARHEMGSVVEEGKGESTSPPLDFLTISDDPLKNILMNIAALPDGVEILGKVYCEKTNVCLMAHLIFYYLA